MVEEAQTTMDEKKRLGQYHRINKLWIEETPAVPLYQQIDLYGANKRLDLEGAERRADPGVRHGHQGRAVRPTDRPARLEVG